MKFSSPLIFFIVFYSYFLVITDCALFESTNYIVSTFNLNNGTSPPLKCEAAAARFGGSIDGDLTGCLFLADPIDACSPIQPPDWNNSDATLCPFMIALIKRGGGDNCSFVKKVLNAQNAHFQYAIVYDNITENILIPMGSDSSEESKKIYIPSFFVNKKCGEKLKNCTISEGCEVTISEFNEVDWGKYLIPFVAVFGLCFLITLIALIVKLVRDRRKELRRRLSKRKLKKIPTRKYKKNETPETCPICLEDFVEGEKLRVLPCKHWYHLKCVDPWLTKNRKVCPVCKRKVLPDEPDSSDSEAGNDDRQASERRPLLSTSSPDTYGAIASYPDADATPEGEYLSPPSSPESGSPSSTRKESHIVLGFTAIRSESNEELIPSTSSADGITNPSYERSEDYANSSEISQSAVNNSNSERFENQPSVVATGKRENIV